LATPTNLPVPSSLFNISAQNPQVRLAIAQDQAFNFYYADNLDLLTHLGFELIPFSPLYDEQIPPAIDGLYLGGGFPELFAEQLSLNHNLKSQLKALIHQGLPTYGECGGLMYLTQNLTNFEGQTFPMLEILPTAVKMGAKLTLGYRHSQVLNRKSWLFQQAPLRGHEFHRSHLTNASSQPLYRHQGLIFPDQAHLEGWSLGHVHGSYLHLHWGNQSDSVKNFLSTCLTFQKTFGSDEK
jgi:cobyrinic acid a,c-diamide synthase